MCIRRFIGLAFGERTIFWWGMGMGATSVSILELSIKSSLQVIENSTALKVGKGRLIQGKWFVLLYLTDPTDL